MGASTKAKLHTLVLRTIGDIVHLPQRALVRALGQSAGSMLHALAWGETTDGCYLMKPERSIGSDKTFEADVDDPVLLKRQLLKLSDRVADRMRSAQLAGRTAVLKVRFADFTTVTRSRTLPEQTNFSREIYAHAVQLFATLGLQRVRVRLVGVRVQGLQDPPAHLRADEARRARTLVA